MNHKAIHSQRLERWLGADKIAQLSQSMKGWYGPPINLRDVPGSVWIGRDGDFCGDFDRGFFASAADSLTEHLKRLWRAAGTPTHGMAAAGFASIGEALSRSSQGHSQMLNVQKVGVTGVASATNSLWGVGNMPVLGANGDVAPGGRVPTSATVGAIPFTHPASGTLHLTGADMSCSIVNNALLLYDRIFDVAKTMNSTATEAVTGVPARYQNTTDGRADSVAGNFLFMECATVLAATAHNWNVCTYTDQTGSGSTLPSVVGNASNIVRRLDMPIAQWFAPLDTGDTGIKALTQMQCSAAVATGAINFVIGHPIGIMAFPLAIMTMPFDWLTNKQQAPRIFSDACLSLLEIVKPSTSATTYVGQLYATSAA